MRNTTLITAQEVIDLAFPNNSNMVSESINDVVIRATEHKYLLPAFGRAMFDALDTRYADFSDLYVKPALAYFVKCELIPTLSLTLSNNGLSIVSPQGATSATDKQRQMLIDAEMSKAQELLAIALEHISEHPEDFPDIDGKRSRKSPYGSGVMYGVIF